MLLLPLPPPVGAAAVAAGRTVEATLRDGSVRKQPMDAKVLVVVVVVAAAAVARLGWLLLLLLLHEAHPLVTPPLGSSVRKPNLRLENTAILVPHLCLISFLFH